MAEMYQDGRLMRSWQGGRARHLAVAADHAWLVEACVRLSELTGRSLWRERAQRVAAELLDLFWDEEPGGFFTTGSDAETLVVRPKEFVDGALPATNSIAIWALLRVDGLDRRRGLATGRRSHGRPRPAPAHPAPGLRWPTWWPPSPCSTGRQEIVVTGERPDLLAEVRRPWLPAAVVAWGEPGESPLFADRPDGFAFVCRGAACDVPADDVATLAGQLEGLRR